MWTCNSNEVKQVQKRLRTVEYTLLGVWLFLSVLPGPILKELQGLHAEWAIEYGAKSHPPGHNALIYT
jgi:hypothetical protein